MEVGKQTNGDFMRSIINILRGITAYCIYEIKTFYKQKKKVEMWETKI